MASVSKEGNLIKVRYDRDDWDAGLLPDANYTSQTGVREGRGFSGALGVNPLRTPGYLQPGYLATDVTNMSSITSGKTILNIATPNTGSFAYGIENSTKLHQITMPTGAISTTGGFPHTIGSSLSGHGGHTSFVGSDVVSYNIGGTPYIFYSWNDGTDGDVGRLTVSGPTFADDYLSASATGGAVLDGTVEHPMIVGDDDVLYIANGSAMQAYNGATNTVSVPEFSVPSGFKITSFAKTANFLVVFCSTRTTTTQEPGQSYAFFWDYSSADATYKYDLGCNYVNGGFNYKGTVGCFGVRPSLLTGTFANRSFMFLFNGSVFEPKKTFNGNIPGHGGVDIVNDFIIWNSGAATGASAMYSYGRIIEGFDNSMNHIANGGGAGTGGVCIASGYTTILMSTGSGAGLQSFTGNFGDAYVHMGLTRLDFGRHGMGRVVSVKVTYKDLVTSGKEFSLAINTDSATTTVNQRGTLQYVVSGDTSLDSLVKHYELDYQGNSLAQFTDTIGLFMQWQSGASDEAHAIHSVEIFIEPINTD